MPIPNTFECRVQFKHPGTGSIVQNEKVVFEALRKAGLIQDPSDILEFAMGRTGAFDDVTCNHCGENALEDGEDV